jgi:hypothetical protein
MCKPQYQLQPTDFKYSDNFRNTEHEQTLIISASHKEKVRQIILPTLLCIIKIINYLCIKSK